MTRAVISLGTNTIRLLVVRERRAGGIDQLEHGAIGTRLGEGLHESGSLAPAAMERTLVAVRTFVGRADGYDAEIHAIATSAMRRAQNASQFAAQISAVIGAPLQILSGEEEAACSFRGATADAPDDDTRRAVLDVGGGSSECAVGSRGNIEDACSIEIGSVRLTEQFPDLDGRIQGAAAQAAASNARIAAANALEPLSAFPVPAEVRAVAGTPLTLGAIILASTVEHVSGRTLTRHHIDALIDALLELPLPARKALPGMLPQRADVLPAGAIIISEALRLLQTDSARLESNDLLLGFLLGLR